MTDTTADKAELAAPDGLEFVHSGIIRFHMADGTVRVRRPFLGELKQIRLALADVQERLVEVATKVTAEGQALQEESAALNDRLGKDDISAEEHAEQLAEIRAQDRAAARSMDEARETLTLAWWEQDVFAALALDTPPPPLQYPAWILDPTLPKKCLDHWRTVPTGPG